MVVFHNDIINAIAQARNIRHLLASDILERWQQGEEATVEQSQSLIQLGNWIDFLTDSEQLVVDGCIDSTDVWNIIQQIGEQAIGLDCVGTNYNYGNPPPTANTNILNYVETVRGLNTNNTDPQNPIVRISVDGSTITGDGTPASPLIATAPLGGVQSVTGNLVNNADPENPIVNSPLTADELAAIQGANAPDGTNVFATLADITGGSQTLSQVLTAGNTSGANDIEFDATQGLLFSNTSRLREGTIDAGLGGTKGIAQICAVGYELKWEAGRLYVMDGNGLFIRQSLYNFTTTPTSTDDTTKGYMVGSLWTLDDGTVYECTDATLGAAVWTNRGIGAGIVYITVGALQTLKNNGELSLTTLYIITDATPYKLMCKAETVSQLSRTATIVDAVYSGQVYYDLQINAISNGVIYDVNNNTWNGTFPTDTVLLGTSGSNIFEQYTQNNELSDACKSNTFKQYASENILGATCEGNIFNAKASENVLGDNCNFNTFEQRAHLITLGISCINNTFGQYATAFTFGDNLQNVTIDAGMTGADYSDPTTYAFLYNKDYAATIFQSGGINYHRYFDIANDRIVVTDLATPANITYIGGGGATPDIQQVLDTGNTSTTPIKIDNGTGNYVQVNSSNIIMEDSSGNALTVYPDSITIQNPSFGAGTIKATTLANNVFFELPNKPAGTQTFAMTSDIVAGGGTVTSVGLSMPSAFSVASSPVTTSGTIAVTGAGVTSQYVRGDGSLANFPSIGGGGASLSYYLNGSVAQGTFGGVAMKEINKTPVIGTGTDFTIAADGYIQSFITDANDPNQLSIPAGNWNFETYFSASTAGGSPSFYVELYKWDGATLTLIASNSTNPEAITGGTATDLYISALAVPQTTLALTDRLAVRIYVTHSGRTIKLHTEDSHLSQIITTFSTGISALNGLTDNVQTFAVGTTGTDFAISSASSIHNFNLPTASASNRGALSSADWTAFNGKQATLVSGTNIKTVEGSTLLGSTPIVVAREIQLACSDETTALTTGTAKVTFRAPRAMVVTGVRASLTTAQSTGSIVTVDINDSGTSILSVKLTIDNNEKTSVTAATPPVISDSAIADDAEITIDIDQIGDGTAKGLKVTILYTI